MQKVFATSTLILKHKKTHSVQPLLLGVHYMLNLCDSAITRAGWHILLSTDLRNITKAEIWTVCSGTCQKVSMQHA